MNKIRNCLSNRIQSHEISYSYTNKFQVNMIGVMLPVGEAVPKEILEGVTVMSLLNFRMYKVADWEDKVHSVALKYWCKEVKSWK